MATTIITKYGSGAPAASDVVRGELAVDTENGRLYTENIAGSVVEIGLNPSGNVDVTGTVTATSFETNAGGTFTTASGNDLNIVYPSARSLFIKEGSETHVTVDNAGNVGIGTTSPIRGLQVQTASSNFGNVFLVDSASGTTGTGGGVIFGSDDGLGTDVSVAAIQGIKENSTAGNQQGALVFTTKNIAAVNTERMRIDSSGNLLVGKTATTFSTEGIVAFNPDDSFGSRINITNDNGVALNLNRKTGDGDIAIFYKDGTTVGSIGTVGTDLYIGSGGAGIRFYESDNSIIPCSDAGVASNGSIDLGDGSFRFKDLYLSGGAYLGGTAAANKLDDYEEGDWTPQLEDTAGNTTSWAGSAVGKYIRVGNMVTAWWFFSSASTAITSRAYTKITGLPFTNQISEYASVCTISRVFDFTWNDENYYIGLSGQDINFRQLGAGNTEASITPTGTQQRFSGGVTFKAG